MTFFFNQNVLYTLDEYFFHRIWHWNFLWFPTGICYWHWRQIQKKKIIRFNIIFFFFSVSKKNQKQSRSNPKISSNHAYIQKKLVTYFSPNHQHKKWTQDHKQNQSISWKKKKNSTSLSSSPWRQYNCRPSRWEKRDDFSFSECWHSLHASLEVQRWSHPSDFHFFFFFSPEFLEEEGSILRVFETRLFENDGIRPDSLRVFLWDAVS